MYIVLFQGILTLLTVAAIACIAIFEIEKLPVLVTVWTYIVQGFLL
jgi:hypothetical protein